MCLRVLIKSLRAALRRKVLGDRPLLIAHRLKAGNHLHLDVLHRLLPHKRIGVRRVRRREDLITRELPQEVLRLPVRPEAGLLVEHVLAPLVEEGLLGGDRREDVEVRVKQGGAIKGGGGHGLLD